jgi:hypothetical protein
MIFELLQKAGFITRLLCIRHTITSIIPIISSGAQLAVQLGASCVEVAAACDYCGVGHAEGEREGLEGFGGEGGVGRRVEFGLF